MIIWIVKMMMMINDSVTRLGDFFIFLVTKFYYKSSLNILVKCYAVWSHLNVPCKTDLATFWAILGQIGQLFISSYGDTDKRLHVDVVRLSRQEQQEWHRLPNGHQNYLLLKWCRFEPRRWSYFPHTNLIDLSPV